MAPNKRTLSRIRFYLGLALFLIITLFPFVMLMSPRSRAQKRYLVASTLLPQQWTLSSNDDIFNPVIFPFVAIFP